VKTYIAAPKIVTLRHVPWVPGKGPVRTEVRDALGGVLFQAELREVAEWLKVFKYCWSYVDGVWVRPDKVDLPV
jgi:hypothetical protein